MATDSKRAQAMVEFALGLFAAVLLFSGIVAASGIMTGRLSLYSKNRAEAGEKALQSSIGSESGSGGAWTRGPDGKQYTADDRRGGGVSLALPSIAGLTVERPGDEAYAVERDILPSSMLDTLRGDPNPATFVKSSGTFDTEIPPFAAKYLFGSEKVRSKVEVSMPAAGGLL